MEQAPRKPAKRVWESVELYTVNCIHCKKWRLVPSKEKYEEIREKIEEQPFSCETAREWRPELSCQDDGDIEQDEHLGWAMDRPNIPQTPPGWQRIIRTRAEGGTKFADVYYVSPSNKRLRSMAELNRYLIEHPEYKEGGVNTSRFSFHAPAPLDKNYVSKRRDREASSSDLQIVPIEANPISCVALYENVDMHSGERESTHLQRLRIQLIIVEISASVINLTAQNGCNRTTSRCTDHKLFNPQPCMAHSCSIL